MCARNSITLVAKPLFLVIINCEGNLTIRILTGCKSEKEDEAVDMAIEMIKNAT